MSKMPLKWHEDCLANMRISLGQKVDARIRLDSEIQRLQDEIRTLDAQIDTARERGFEAFDDDRFLKPRKAKQS